MDRRNFLFGSIAAPVIITTPGLLMPVRPWIKLPWWATNLTVTKFSGDLLATAYPNFGDVMTVEPNGLSPLPGHDYCIIKRGEFVDFSRAPSVYDCWKSGIWTPRDGIEFTLPLEDVT